MNPVCSVRNIDHIGIVVRDLDEALGFYRETFGMNPGPVEELPDQGVKATLIELGETRLELIQPTRPGTATARFLESRGEGLHHIAFRVEDIQGKLEVLKGKGLTLIDQEPREGLSGTIAFVHPKSVYGVLLELVQRR